MEVLQPKLNSGKTADYVLEKDWSSHPLGPYEFWPTTLKCALNIIKHSKFPKLIFWGVDLFVFYNDAFRQSIGTEKHPATIGMRFDDAYPESKRRMRPVIEKVLQTGESSYFVDELVPIQRNGCISEAYWTFSHSPLMDEFGTPLGIFLDCFETTDSFTKTSLSRPAARDFKSLSDSLSQPVFATDATGVITYANSSLLAYTGKSFEELQSAGWEDIVPAEDLENVIDDWKDAVALKSSYSTEVRYKKHNGEIRSFLVSCIPVLDVNGSVIRWVGSSFDIQSLKDQEKEKDIFIGMASHELKTPVTSIKAYVQLLLRKYATNEDKLLANSLTKLDAQVNSLTILIKDMLDLSKMKTGNLELNKGQFCVDNIIRDVIDELALVHINHNFNYQNPDKSVIYCDKDRISQVLINLLTNAIKYAPDSYEISITCESTNDTLRVSITDKGIGLSKSDLEHVFERFYRSEGKNQATFPGFGIGLYIAADIVQRHNGSIGAESTLGVGSTFYFDLPISNPV